ncbi:carboxypeptidase M32 [Bacillus sp. PS06]|uniref:carboxypeptidase M32 n=1 Tax=Bacillus sp. PS06 TaxID=2764176 RepID=UPI001780B98C|nr:carboxypeptidase M32 [Bacillus sp. PS06]MBD8068053.1 carboxypeptidase M32 [Bacillus sp. PS06]
MLKTSENIDLKEANEQFKALDEKITHFSNVLGLAAWDQRTKAAKKGRSLFAKAIGTLSTEAFKLTISEEMGQLLHTLTLPENYDSLDPVTKACVRERLSEYEKSKKIPADVFTEYVVLRSNANNAWEDARKNNDFASFQPYLEKMVDFKKKFAEYYGYEGHPYNALLDEYEPGLTVEKLDPLFAELREKSIALLEKIQSSSNQPRKDIFEKEYDIDAQKAFNQFILPKLGYDLEAGRLDETTHPFALAITTGDVRITTRYLKENVRSAIFGTIHETGHALYEQGVNPEFEGTVIRRGASFGIHESQSRFLENMVGRSTEFWTYFYKDIKKYFPTQLGEVSLEDFYEAINLVEPSYIRVEADELTYNLHIMIRYEIEKGLISGEIEVKDLPQVWNEKMKDYLGVVPENDTLGVLQDVHWSQGGFGYFPSYSLGNLYAAQILHTITKEIPNFYELIEQGDFLVIREWLKEQIHQYGKLYTPAELIKKVTGEDLNASYLIHYLEEKYTNIYKL